MQVLGQAAAEQGDSSGNLVLCTITEYRENNRQRNFEERYIRVKNGSSNCKS